MIDGNCHGDCPSNHPPMRSINDYSNDEEVEAALRDSIHCINSNGAKYHRKPQQASLKDWCLSPGCSSPEPRQAIRKELRRLKALKSFQVLDADVQSSEPCHDRSCTRSVGSHMCLNTAKASSAPESGESSTTNPLTTTLSTLNRLVDMATRTLDASTVAISVTDMERQKILAANGLFEGVEECPRQFALGAHIVSSQQVALVVPDLTTDERFQHLVVEPIIGDVRFYASAPLITPEGERIGSVCVLDNMPRPEGMDENQLELLRHTAGLAMQSLVERRTRLRLEKKLKSATRVVSATVHDLLTPLTAIELALSLLHEDPDFQGKLSQQQKESVKIASNCVGVLGQMCRKMRDQDSASCKRQVNGINTAGSVPIAAPSSLMQLPNADVGLSADSFRIMYGSGHTGNKHKDNHGPVVSTKAIDAVSESVSSETLFENKVLAAPRVTVTVEGLVKSIHMAVDAIPKTVPVAISLHGAVPPRIVTDDLKVLRCALNLLEHCASIATSGSILLSIKAQYCCCGKAMLGFHCENRFEGDSCENSNPASVEQCIRDCCSATRIASSHSDLSMSTASTASTCSTSSSSTAWSRVRVSRRASTSSVSFPSASPLLDCCHQHGSFERQCLRNCSEINLYSVAMQMDALGGDCGLDDPAGHSCGKSSGNNTEERSFWFRIPLLEPSCPKVDKEVLHSMASRLSTTTPEKNNDPSSPDQGPEKIQDLSQEQARDGLEPALVLEAQPRKRRALIIEDSIVIRKVIANALSKIGYETETAVNGMEGLHQLQCSIYDVVLCDFLMPVMDGLDCVKQYRDWEKLHRPYLHQYIIGMSAHASDQDVRRGLEAGMDCYKPKPLTYKGLKNIVDACEGDRRKNLLSISKSLDAAREKATAGGNMDVISQALPSYDRQQPKMCLIAARDNDSFDLARLTEARGWKSLIVHDGEDALHALKKRNWDAVLLDEKLPLLSGRMTAEEFRQWERENRVNCQANMFILTSSTKKEVPNGVNGVLSKPVNPKAFEQLLEKAEEPSLNIIMR